jgi:hypothetical protein
MATPRIGHSAAVKVNHPTAAAASRQQADASPERMAE